MTIFNLPDLGEGLPDAEIHEWFIKEGDTVKVDQPIVSMETAKAVVDVPSPQEGVIVKLYGKPGDLIKTGEPLIAFAASAHSATSDKGTVVGALEESSDVWDDHFTIGSRHSSSRIKASPSVRLFAKKLGVNLQELMSQSEGDVITREKVQQAANLKSQPPEGFEPLRGVRKAMLHSMVHSHQEVVPVSLFDEANLSNWTHEQDITVRLIKSVIEACKQEPSLNAWFDSQHSARKCFKEVHLGLAMDNAEGLFVPVIHNTAQYSDQELRQQINQYKQDLSARAIEPEHFKGATFTLSNFGKFAGRFASPIIVPPMVAILAVGRLYQGAAVHQGKIDAHPLLPLSLSFDHRAVTGGEATRFLGAVIAALEKP